MITAVKTGRLLDVDIRPNLVYLVQNMYAHKGEDVFFLPIPREGLFHLMLVRNQHINEQKELTMCEFESQDATEITSASAESRINVSWAMMSLLVRTFLVLGSYDFFSHCFTFFSPSFVTKSSSKPIGVGRVKDVHGNLLSVLNAIATKIWRFPSTTSTRCLMRRKGR